MPPSCGRTVVVVVEVAMLWQMNTALNMWSTHSKRPTLLVKVRKYAGNLLMGKHVQRLPAVVDDREAHTNHVNGDIIGARKVEQQAVGSPVVVIVLGHVEGRLERHCTFLMC